MVHTFFVWRYIIVDQQKHYWFLDPGKAPSFSDTIAFLMAQLYLNPGVIHGQPA
jgi:hypothetical protein